MGLRPSRRVGAAWTAATSATHGPRQRLRAGIGYIPEDRQEDGLVGDFSVADNLVLDVYDRQPFASGIALNLDAIAGERGQPGGGVRRAHLVRGDAGRDPVRRQPAEGHRGPRGEPGHQGAAGQPADPRPRRRVDRVRAPPHRRAAGPRAWPWSSCSSGTRRDLRPRRPHRGHVRGQDHRLPPADGLRRRTRAADGLRTGQRAGGRGRRRTTGAHGRARSGSGAGRSRSRAADGQSHRRRTGSPSSERLPPTTDTPGQRPEDRHQADGHAEPHDRGSGRRGQPCRRHLPGHRGRRSARRPAASRSATRWCCTRGARSSPRPGNAAQRRPGTPPRPRTSRCSRARILNPHTVAPRPSTAASVAQRIFYPLSQTASDATPLILTGLSVAHRVPGGPVQHRRGGPVGRRRDRRRPTWASRSACRRSCTSIVCLLGGFVGGAVIGWVVGELKAQDGRARGHRHDHAQLHHVQPAGLPAQHATAPAAAGAVQPDQPEHRRPTRTLPHVGGPPPQVDVGLSRRLAAAAPACGGCCPGRRSASSSGPWAPTRARRAAPGWTSSGAGSW